MNTEGIVSLVTGGASGLGRATVAALADARCPRGAARPAELGGRTGRPRGRRARALRARRHHGHRHHGGRARPGRGAGPAARGRALRRQRSPGATGREGRLARVDRDLSLGGGAQPGRFLQRAAARRRPHGPQRARSTANGARSCSPRRSPRTRARSGRRRTPRRRRGCSGSPSWPLVTSSSKLIRVDDHRPGGHGHPDPRPHPAGGEGVARGGCSSPAPARAPRGVRSPCAVDPREQLPERLRRSGSTARCASGAR